MPGRNTATRMVLLRQTAKANNERDNARQQLADVSRERDVLAEKLREVCAATGVIDGTRLGTGVDVLIGGDCAIEWIKSAKRVL